jgi:Rhodopsin-like GPCR transmembrane domain
LGSFAVIPDGARIHLSMEAKGRYDGSGDVRFRAYRDTEWDRFQKRTLCTDKVELAQYLTSITFMDKLDGTYQVHAMLNIEKVHLVTKEKAERNHYWYFVIDDCSLEKYFHDDRVPKIQYEISMRNSQHGEFGDRFSEMSADDTELLPIHSFSMLSSIMVIFLLLMNIVYRLNFDVTKQYTIHAAVLWVTGACLLDILSGFCELIHLSVYNRTGVGFYLMDALSAHFDASCDAAIIVLLLSIAAGWTLPSSVVMIAGTTTNAGLLAPVQKFVSSLAHPISMSLQGPSGLLAMIVTGVHILLAQWGRIYNDDFDSYHDMDHLPGRILLWIRILCGLLFLVAVQTTASSPKCPPALAQFYRAYGIIGVAWFWSLPLWIWYCSAMVPVHKHKSYVFGGSSLLQCASLIVLALLVTTQNSTAYHQYSRIATSNQRDTLTDSLDQSLGGSERNSSTSTFGVGSSNPSTTKTSWSIGSKAKVRLD